MRLPDNGGRSRQDFVRQIENGMLETVGLRRHHFALETSRNGEQTDGQCHRRRFAVEEARGDRGAAPRTASAVIRSDASVEDLQTAVGAPIVDVLPYDVLANGGRVQSHLDQLIGIGRRCGERQIAGERHFVRFRPMNDQPVIAAQIGWIRSIAICV